MCNSLLDPMAQKIPKQELLPQMDPKREMGAAAAAVDFATPPLLRQIPSPVPSKTAHHNGGAGLPSPLVRAQMMEMITQAMRGETQQVNQSIIRLTQTLRDETRQMGHGLQADKMAPPRATTSELQGSAPAGEDRVIRETCRVTEKVTVREKLNRVTETCTAGRQVTELTETREVVERLHGVEEKDGVVGRAHTHTHR